jgi:hypothetical protein
MTKDEEIYLFLSQSINILDDSLNILVELKNENITPILFNAAFRYSLIEYSKPFVSTNGLLKSAQETPVKIKYDIINFVPPEKLDLHQRIINSRHQFHAHGDMTVFDAQLNIQDSQEGKIVIISKNIVHGSQEFENVDHIISMIQETLNNMENKLSALKGELPQNCTFLDRV